MAPAGLTVAQLAERLGGEVEGEGADGVVLLGVAGMAEAGPQHLSFVSNRRYVRQLATTRAGAVLVDRKTPVGDRLVIRCDDPYAAFAGALALFHPQAWPAPGVHPQAHVADDAVVLGATIEAMAFVGPGAVVGLGSWVQAGAVVSAGATVGRDCRLMANSVVAAGCAVGDRVWLNPGAVVGGEGFGFAPTAQGNLKIPQVGRTVIEDDVEIGANSCVDRAAMGETVVRRGAKLDNLCQVGHAAEIGPHSMMVAYSGVAGSSVLGQRVVLAAKAAVLGHIELGDGVQVGVASAVRDSQPAGARVTGVPAIPHKQWLRSAHVFADLPQLARTQRKLQGRLDALEQARHTGMEATVSDADSADPGATAAASSTGEPGGGVAFDIHAVLEMLPHRYPFLMVDRVLECEPGVSAVAVKCVSINEPYFQGHFPGMPIMPGVMLAEAFAQVAGIVYMSATPDAKDKAVFLLGLDKLRFRKPVRPGDRVVIRVEKTVARKSLWRFKAVAHVDGVKVADGEVMATVGERTIAG